jgi:predicted HicB family RNase H-like nuclease
MKKIQIKTGKKISADDWVKEKEAMKPYIKTKQFTFKVSEDLHHKFHLTCALRRITMKDFFIKSMEQCVNEGVKLGPWGPEDGDEKP